MHAANPDTSIRAARTLSILKQLRIVGATTAEIQMFTGSMAVATDVSALRHHGHRINCVHERTASSGTKVYRYFYEGREARGRNPEDE